MNPIQVLIQTFTAQLQYDYWTMYGQSEPDCYHQLGMVSQTILEELASGGAASPHLQRTILVTLIGQAMLQGRYLQGRDVTVLDWSHTIIALLLSEIGCIPGVCHTDTDDFCTTGVHGGYIHLPSGAAAEALAPYRVDRGQCVARERFREHDVIDVERLAICLERTRYPLPSSVACPMADDYPNLVRAACLVGQLAEPQLSTLCPSHTLEPRQVELTDQYTSERPQVFQNGTSAFTWRWVYPYIKEELDYLRLTPAGKQWLAKLYDHVLPVEATLGF